MELEERAEEILETLWVRTEEGQADSLSLDDFAAADKESLEQLVKTGYVAISDDRVRLTSTGQPEARNVVRRHRLAERLLADVLGTGDMLIHEKACKFEHLLDHGLDESICSLLGHPQICPHGKPIPPGRCCREEQRQISRLVLPLAQLTPGQKGKVAYIHAPESGELQKLMAMGILPGAPVSLLQSFPSYVFQVSQTQFAVDKEIADTIFVRLVAEPTHPTAAAPPGHHRRQGGRLDRGFGWWRGQRR